jgi:hypothetical protein
MIDRLRGGRLAFPKTALLDSHNSRGKRSIEAVRQGNDRLPSQSSITATAMPLFARESNFEAPDSSTERRSDHHIREYLRKIFPPRTGRWK